MICSLKCFCDFLEAQTNQQQNAIIKRYKKGITQSSKGMVIYYSPALQLMRGRLCPNGTLAEKLKSLPAKCFIKSWTDKLNDARLESNTLVFKAFYSEFGNKKLKVFSSPRLQCLLSTDVAISMQPDLYAEVDGVSMVWKLGLSKDSPNEQTIRYILQMMNRALKHKGIDLPIEQICYFDVRPGKIYVEKSADGTFVTKIAPKAAALAKAWEAVA